MSSISSSYGRTTSLLSSNQLLLQLRRTQDDLNKAQLAISTGREINKPSDAPARTSAILLINQQLDARAQQDRNLDHIVGMLNNVDQAMGDIGALAIEAHSLGLSQIGITSDAATREAEAAVVDGQISGLMDITNRRIGGIGLFTGNANRANVDNLAFEPFLGGIRYLGGTTDMISQAGLSDPLAYNYNGADGLNALSGRVAGAVDLSPNAFPSTRLDDLDGTLGRGIRRGTFQINVDGTLATVDLNTAQNMNDVVTRVQNAIDNIDPTAGSFQLAGGGFELTAAAGHALSISDLPAGVTAQDLGIELTATNASTVAGADPGVNLTMQTLLTDLGPSVDWTGGLKITQGATTKIADFSNAKTVQDLNNVIDGLHMGLRFEINDAGTGMNLISEVSGINLTIGENAGGTTAGDLGVRTFSTTTKLRDFNRGVGVDRAQGEDDVRVSLHDGRAFDINLDNAVDVEDVLATFGAAATAAGLSVGNPGDLGTDFNIGLAADGNGFTLEDNTAGATNFEVTQLNESLAATDLGILINAGTANTMTGQDNAAVQVDSIFTHLFNLKESLLKNDSRGISLATSDIERDTEFVTQGRARIGIRTQRAERAQERSSELKITEEILLSDLQEGDMTELILKFQQLQQQLQASLSVGAQNLQQSLLNFLR